MPSASLHTQQYIGMQMLQHGHGSILSSMILTESYTRSHTGGVRGPPGAIVLVEATMEGAASTAPSSFSSKTIFHGSCISQNEECCAGDVKCNSRCNSSKHCQVYCKRCLCYICKTESVMNHNKSSHTYWHLHH